MSRVAVRWMEENSRLFVCQDADGNRVLSGVTEDDGRKNGANIARPADLLLMGLASCAAYDVVSILERQRQSLAGLRIEVEGRQNNSPPREFTEIHMRFILTGDRLNSDKVNRALDLSINRYCSVAATIRGVAAITYEFEIEE